MVLGLTLAGAAILTTIGGDAFRARLAQVPGSGGQEAPILELLSNFIVAMMVQLTALIYAVVFQAKPFDASWLRVLGVRETAAEWINIIAGGIGSLLLVYAILLILGAAFTVRALATVYVLDARAEEPSSAGQPPAGSSSNAGGQIDGVARDNGPQKLGAAARANITVQINGERTN